MRKGLVTAVIYICTLIYGLCLFVWFFTYGKARQKQQSQSAPEDLKSIQDNLLAQERMKAAVAESDAARQVKPKEAVQPEMTYEDVMHQPKYREIHALVDRLLQAKEG